MARQKGFTLIEVMIVVVIVAILAAVAVPSYQDSIRKTRRADAKEALTRIAALQERFFFTNNRYGTLFDLGLVPTAGVEQVDSVDGHYTIILAGALTCGTAPNQFPCYTLQANPVAAGSQADDQMCGSFSNTQTGRRAATKKGDATYDTTEECW